MKIFIAGPRKISQLNISIREKLDAIQNNNYDIVIGDANGVDKAVQDYLFSKEYRKVTVFASEGIVRNNIGSWEVISINPRRKTRDFKYYAAKDIVMAEQADYGFMVWNGVSKGTLHNIIRLIVNKKGCFIYYTPAKKMLYLSQIKELDGLMKTTIHEIQEQYVKLKKEILDEAQKQVTFYNVGG